MLTLILDTASRYLNIGIMNDDELIVNYSAEANKRQSEITMSTIQKLFNQHQHSVKDIDSVVITKGPGSYTGVRIAMTIAKVFCAFKPATLYAVNTLHAYVGNKTGFALMDARAKRVFCAAYENGVEVLAPTIKKIEEITVNGPLYGDAYVLNKESLPVDVISNIVAIKKYWEKIEDIDELTPLYLKENEAYGSTN